MMTMEPQQGSVTEYIAALKASGKFGPQVRAHRIVEATTATTASCGFLAPELQAMLRDMGITTDEELQQALDETRIDIALFVEKPSKEGAA